MTIDEILKMRPETALFLARCARGPHEDRKMIWIASWDGGYFTSDTDRYIFHGCRDEATGATAEEALSALVNKDLAEAKRCVEYHEKELLEAKDRLMEVTRRMEQR